jgi:hypothetical protein
VSLAFPPVGWQRTVWQPGHTTTVWEWLKTVVLQKKKSKSGVSRQEKKSSEAKSVQQSS